MTLKQIESFLNKGLLTEDEANRLLCKVIDERQETDDDWLYQKQAREEKEYNCADADIDDVDFSEIEV